MALPILGQDRWFNYSYPINSIHKAGGVIIAGSDWFVSSMNPFESIEVGISRIDPLDPERDPLNPEERVTLPTVLAMYTINAAYAMHQEDKTGSLEAGKFADLIVLDRNLFQIPVKDISETRVLWTLLEGKEVYREEGSSFPNAK